MNGQATKTARRWSLLSQSTTSSPAPEPPHTFYQLPAQQHRETPEQQTASPNVLAKPQYVGLSGKHRPAQGVRDKMAPLLEEEGDKLKDGAKTRNFFGLRKVKNTSKNRSVSDGAVPNAGTPSALHQNGEDRREQRVPYRSAARQPTTPAQGRAPEPGAWAATAMAINAPRADSMPTNTRRWSASPYMPLQSMRLPVPEANPFSTVGPVSSVSASGTLVGPSTVVPAGNRGRPGVSPQSCARNQLSHPTEATIQHVPKRPHTKQSIEIIPSPLQPTMTTASAPVIPTVAHPDVEEHRRMSEWGITSTSDVPPPSMPQVSHSNWAATSKEFRERQKLNTQLSQDNTDWATKSEEFRKSQVLKTQQWRDNVALAVEDGRQNEIRGNKPKDDEESSGTSVSSNAHTRSNSVASKSTVISTSTAIRSKKVMDELAKLYAQQEDEKQSQKEGFRELPPNIDMPVLKSFITNPAELEGTTVSRSTTKTAPQPLEQIAELHSDDVPRVQIEGEVVPPSLIPGPHNHRRAATDVRYKDMPTTRDEPSVQPSSTLPTNPAYPESSYRHPPKPGTSRRQSESTPPVSGTLVYQPLRHSVDLGAGRRHTTIVPPSLKISSTVSAASKKIKTNSHGPDLQAAGHELDFDPSTLPAPKTITPPVPVLQYIPPPPPPPPEPPVTPPPPPEPPAMLPPPPEPPAMLPPPPPPSPNYTMTPQMTHCRTGSLEIEPPPETPPPPLPPKPLPYIAHAMFNYSQAYVPTRFVRAGAHSPEKGLGMETPTPQTHAYTASVSRLPTPEADRVDSHPPNRQSPPTLHSARPPAPEEKQTPAGNRWHLSDEIKTSLPNPRDAMNIMDRKAKLQAALEIANAGADLPKRMFSIPRKPVPRQ